MITAYLDCHIAFAQRRTTRHPDRRKVTHLRLRGVRWPASEVQFNAPGLHIVGVHDPQWMPEETVRDQTGMELLPQPAVAGRWLAARATGVIEMYVDGWVQSYCNATHHDGSKFCALRFRVPAFASNEHFLHALPVGYMGVKRDVEVADLPERYVAPSGKAYIGHRREWTLVGHRPMPFTSAVDSRD